MREILIGIGLCVVLFGGAFAVRSATMMQLLYSGSALVAGGLIFSMPFAVWYHVRLYRVLEPRGVLPRWRWILNPTSYHSKLSEEESGTVLPWFYLGAFGWVVSVLGLVVLGLSIWVGRNS